MLAQGSRVHLGLLAEREVARSRRLLTGTQICFNSFACISCADCSLVYSDRQIQQAVCDSSRVASVCQFVCIALPEWELLFAVTRYCEFILAANSAATFTATADSISPVCAT